MTRAFTPVSDEGNSKALTPPYSPVSMSFFQVMRKRLAGSTSHRPILGSRALTDAGTFDGSRICASVGITTPFSRHSFAAFSSTASFTFVTGSSFRAPTP